MIGLDKNSVILAEQIRTIDKTRLQQRVAMLNDEVMQRVDQALLVSLELDSHTPKKASKSKGM